MCAWYTACEHGHRKPCGIRPEKFVLVTPLALGDFTNINSKWQLPFEQQAKLFLDTLRGVQMLHAAGYMHRDISSKNLLILTLEPVPQAAVCDFGKATKKAESKHSYIGPPDTLAPEVPTNEWSTAPAGGGTTINPSGRYDRKIDIWGLAYGSYHVLRPQAPRIRMDQPQHLEAMAFLGNWGRQDANHGRFAVLIRRMLAWNPSARPSAGEASEDVAMDEIKGLWADKGTNESAGDKRPRRLSTDSTVQRAVRP